MKIATHFKQLIDLSLNSASRTAVLCSIALQLFAVPPARAFTDTSKYWARDCIAQLKEMKLASGYPNGTFRPDATVTRAEFAILMLNAFPNAPKVGNAKTFSDVPANFWAAKAIREATERGFFAGYPDNTFRPQQAIPRVQGLVVLVNAQQLPIYAVPEPILKRYFTDAAQIPPYAGGAIASAADSEVIVNYPNVLQLRPNQNMTRGEVAVQVCNAKGLKRLVSRKYVTSEVNLIRDQLIFGPEIRAFGNSSQDLLMAYGTNDKIGYVSHSGITVIPARYNQAKPFSEGLAAVQVENNDLGLGGYPSSWGYIDFQGNWVVQPQYSSAGGFSDGLAAVSLISRDRQKFGFIDRAGQIIVPLEYDQVLPFSEGLAAVAKNNRWGFIDKTGKIIVPLEYDSASPFSEGMARISAGNQVGFIDKAGNLAIAPQFSVAWDFSENLAPALDRTTQRWGFLDKTGNWAISPQFEEAQTFSEGLAGVAIDGKWGFINHTGQITIPLQFYGPQVTDFAIPNLAMVRPFKNGFAFVRYGDKIGFIDHRGRWQVEPRLFNDAEEIADGIARVHVGGQWVPVFDYPNNTPVLREVVLEGGGWGYIRVPRPASN